MATSNSLTRSSNRMIGGVCQGIANYTGIDVTIVRIAAVIIALWSGLGLALYAILWIALPEDTSGRTGFEVLKGEAQKYTNKSTTKDYDTYDQR